MVQKRTEDRSAGAKSRAHDKSESKDRPDTYQYTPAAQLSTPVDPDYQYRWCAEYVNGEYRAATIQRHMHDGYQRVMVDQLPEGFILFDPRDEEGATRYGGLILMRCPRFKHNARQAYFEKQSRSRLTAANELQGIAGRDAVEEDRGTRALTGEDAARALQNMNQN